MKAQIHKSASGVDCDVGDIADVSVAGGDAVGV
jgi:hypothetical protein